MTITPIKAEKVIATALGALHRDIVLPQLIWLDPVGDDFKGAKGDSVTIKIPAVTSARKRTMRSGTTRNRDSLAEGKISVKLDTNLYKDVPITDEELTLDIEDFAAQVLTPITTAMAEGWEEEIAELMTDADYAQSINWDDFADPHKAMLRRGRLLSNAKVPQGGRFCVLGSALAEEFLGADVVRRNDSAGAAGATALQDAAFPKIGGFTPVVVPALPEDFGVAFHRTAFAGTSKVPVVPDGVPWGASRSYKGLSMRVIQAFDPSADGWENVLGFDSFVGTGIVEDHGAFDGEGEDSLGKFVPAENPDNEDGEDLLFVRAVAINPPSGS